MEMGSLEIYLIIINVLGFILFAVNTWLYAHTEKGQIDKVLTITSLLGGSLGIILSIVLFGDKAEKVNMMSRVFVICVFIIELMIYLIVKGHITDNINFAFWTFFDKYKFLLIYLGIINVITFIAFAFDKYRAIKGGSRIRIVTLLGLSLIGGSIGGLLAMYLFRHKIRKDYFTFGIPLIIVMQIVVLFYVMNVM